MAVDTRSWSGSFWRKGVLCAVAAFPEREAVCLADEAVLLPATGFARTAASVTGGRHARNFNLRETASPHGMLAADRSWRRLLHSMKRVIIDVRAWLLIHTPCCTSGGERQRTGRPAPGTGIGAAALRPDWAECPRNGAPFRAGSADDGRRGRHIALADDRPDVHSGFAGANTGGTCASRSRSRNHHEAPLNRTSPYAA